MITKKYFEQAAAIIAECPDFSRTVVAEAFIRLFQADNPRFDRERFLVACDLIVAPPKRTKQRRRAGDPFSLDS